MEQAFDISRLLLLRSLTTRLADHFAKQVREHLSNLGPLLQPHTLLGDLVRSGKSAVKGQDAALQELTKLYQPIARATALNLQTELKPPLDIFSASTQIAPASYTYTPEGSSKAITITTPLRWVLSYKDLGPQQLRELIASHARSGGGDLQLCVLHFLAMYLLTHRRPGIAPVLEALRFPLTSNPINEFAGIPFVYVSSPISTMRPPDPIILQSTQISGTSTFEEVVNVDDIARLSDPLKAQVVALVKEHGGELARDLGL
ncbi:MAG: hypothetical protein ABI612_19935 [Betaproteobacteria bacterium]